MKALTVMAPNDVRLIDVKKPAVGPKDVLSRVKYCGVCGTDAAIISGDISFVRDGLIKYPVRIGHEWSGIVEEVGSEVNNFKPGDRVVGDDSVVCGECRNCMEGNYGICESGRGVGTINCWDGAFAEYMLMPARQMYKLPDSIPLDEAALIEPAAIAYNGLKQSNIRPGTKILIIGTGPIGLAAVGLAKSMGATGVYVSGRKDVKLQIGKIMGADVLVNSTKVDLKGVIAQCTGGKGVDVVLETSGNIDTIQQAMDVVRPGGIVTLIGFYEKALNSFNIDKVTINSITIKGVNGTANAFPPVIDLMEAGRLTLKPLVTDTYAFEHVMSALKAVDEKSATRIKVLVEF